MNIIELELLSDDIAGTEKFYRKVLGLQGTFASRDEVMFTFGFTRLIFRESVNVKPGYHFAVDVPNNLFEAAYNYIKSKVALLPLPDGSDIADFKNWLARSFYFYDNNGNIVEFITRYANRAVAAAPFSAKSYKSISEIGLVTSNVAELAGRIKDEFSIPLYHRQPPAKKFTVCGDDEGLFIMVEEGREWFPVSLKSQHYSTVIKFYHEGVMHHITR